VATRVGTTLDRYVIDAELGRGAMGVVYRAHDPKLGRTVAIKMISTAGLDTEAEKEYRERFVVEANAAGRFSHPGIVTIFDVREEAEPYLVMEYIEGQSLQQLMGRDNRPLPLSTTLRLVQEVAEALHYAHALGVVHRDIKPANILVTTDGHPKIADFGIAKLNQTDLTMPGQVLGSPAFMAPEQLSEESVDSRSDLFSLGVILYYMLTGYRPFQGNSTTTVCFKLVNHDPVPASALESKVPTELDEIVSRAMAKDPAERYQTGMAMASDLQTLRERSGFTPSSDRSEQNLKRDAIPRYVKGTSAEMSTAERGWQKQKAEDSVTFKKKKSMFSTTVVIFGVAAMLVANVALWTGQGLKSTESGPVAMQQQINSSVVASEAEVVSDKTGDEKVADDKAISDKTDGDKSTQTAPKTSARKAKKPLSPAHAAFPETHVPIPTASGDATLQIEIEHHFSEATASVWVDDRLVYTQSLLGKKQRRALVLKKVVGHQFQAVRVVPGKHLVRVRIQSEADSYDQSKVTSVAFNPGISLLKIVCDDKGEGLQLDFKKDGDQ
jgi:serine/threonine protein kinase